MEECALAAVCQHVQIKTVVDGGWSAGESIIPGELLRHTSVQRAGVLDGISKNRWQATNPAGGFIGNNPHHRSIVWFLMNLDQSNYQFNFHRKQKSDVCLFPKRQASLDLKAVPLIITCAEQIMNPDRTGADVWNKDTLRPAEGSLSGSPAETAHSHAARRLHDCKSASCQRAGRPPPRYFISWQTSGPFHLKQVCFLRACRACRQLCRD